MDFMSDSLENGRSLRTFNVVDDFNREFLTIDVGFSLPTKRVIRSLEHINGSGNELTRVFNAVRIMCIGTGCSHITELNRLINSNYKYKNIIEIDHIQELHIYSYIHRKHSDLEEKIAATLKIMKQDGTFSQITAESIALFNK